jgi:hypothetical protein
MTSHGFWRRIDPDAGGQLAPARDQLHHAVQFGTAIGISWLEPRPDDSHTNLGWDEDLGAITSRSARGSRGAVALGVRAHDLTGLVTLDGSVRETIPLHGLTLDAATDRIRTALADAGLDAERYTLRRHFEIPPLPVSDGASFDTANADAFGELARWYANAASELGRIASITVGASEVRIWPHHFDIATLVTIGPGRTTGAGMSPGDGYYDEPYFYVNAYPTPSPDRLVAELDGRGTWHTHEWIGAVLPASRLDPHSEGQQSLTRRFLESALAACRALL